MAEPTAQAAAPLLLNSRDAAKALAISERTLARLTATGEIPHLRIGRLLRFDLRDLQAWIDRQKEARHDGP